MVECFEVFLVLFEDGVGEDCEECQRQHVDADQVVVFVWFLVRGCEEYLE